MHINNKDILFNKVSSFFFPMMEGILLSSFLFSSSSCPQAQSSHWNVFSIFCRLRENLISDFVGDGLFCHFLAVAFEQQIQKGHLGGLVLFI